MSYHPGTCMFPVKFPYTPEAIREIPVETVRKFANLGGWDERFYWNEGDRVRLMQNEGKRVLGTLSVGTNDQWAKMSDTDWERKVKLFVDNVRVRGIEVGNEVGAAFVGAYLPKLEIASNIIREAGGWVMLSSPYPGGESKVWDQIESAGAWDLVDGVAIHPYALTPAKVLAKVVAFRDRLTSYGGRASRLGLHATEFGWGTLGGYLQTSEEGQAFYLTETFAIFKANATRLKLNNCLWYTFNDSEGLPGGDPHGCGVVRKDGTRKPSYDALAAA